MKAQLGGSVVRDRFDSYIKTNRVLLISRQKVRSGYSGLFWFSDDYKDIEDIRGLQEFTNGDILFYKEVGPQGSHSDYRDLDLRRPKGRVTLMPDGVVINVGLKCPDTVIEMVKRRFELVNLNEVVRVNRGSHWDSKK